MDDWLDERGLYRKNTALDGSCLFRAVAEQLIPANPINGHIVLRKQCVVFLRNNKYLYQDRVSYHQITSFSLIHSAETTA